MVFAEPQDHNVLATKSTTKLPTHVWTVMLVNSQEMELTNKMVDAKLTNKTVMLEVKSNWVNNNALHAKVAQLELPYKMVNA